VGVGASHAHINTDPIAGANHPYRGHAGTQHGPNIQTIAIDQGNTDLGHEPETSSDPLKSAANSAGTRRAGVDESRTG
jgi:hypothetical protein